MLDGRYCNLSIEEWKTLTPNFVNGKAVAPSIPYIKNCSIFIPACQGLAPFQNKMQHST
jgi:hypothetical protein